MTTPIRGAIPASFGGASARVRKLIQEETIRKVHDLSHLSDSDISNRIGKLAREWDIDRVLIFFNAGFSLFFFGLTLFLSKWWVIIPFLSTLSLLQYAISGWTPLALLLRNTFYLRTLSEIMEEKEAMKVLRGDFNFAGQTDRITLAKMLESNKIEYGMFVPYKSHISNFTQTQQTAA
eukprot:TRINITY_DN368_c0_g1_i1.p1 TRINITY_DN368_c0_g1~~TRINITY_DN368_c0_g1_i1.p1  ORF type:complete len:178 (-),score=24.67 TRINITY_DN368_c0_g1_i1:64-597(-)